MRARGFLGVLLGTAAASAFAQPAGWESFGPPLFQVSDVATGSDETTVYASSANTTAGQSGIFRSTDAGNSWTGLVQAPSGEFYGDILVDPGNPQTLYTGTLGGTGNVTRLYRSLDGGTNWFLGQTLSTYCVPSFAPGATSGTVLVACGTGLWRTTDSGQSWRSQSAPFSQATRLATGAGGAVYAYGPSTLFRSIDGGATWQAAGTPLPCAGMNALAADPTQPNVLVAGAGLLGASGLACGGIYRSADGGATWTPASVSARYITDVVINVADPTRVYSSAGTFPVILPEGGVFASLDGGSTWTDTQLPPGSAGRLALSPHRRILYAATPLGVYQLGVTSGTPRCTPNDFTLCLDAARYRVQAGWTKPDQTSGSGHAMGLTGDTGYFWFFDPTNVELIVKVLEGCGVNDHRWVFASGLTNVFVNLTVTDILTNVVKTYTNAQGTAFVPVQDTSAFHCVP